MDAAAVAAYLKAHPEFFDDYADLLAQVLLPDPHGGRAISITERQLTALRSRTKKLEGKLGELLHFGEENDVTSEKMHRLAAALVAAEDLTAVLTALYDHLGKDFAVPHVALHLWGLDAPAGEEERQEFMPPDAATLTFAASLKRPYCGPVDKLDALAWLSAEVQSAAILPLQCRGGTLGLLTLGSEELHRYYPEMGTVFLERLADLASAALWRTLHD